MPVKHIITGISGEKAACQFLEKRGFKIIATNWRYKHLEVDIIMHDGPILVFVEVKTRSNAAFGLPYESVDLQKQKKLDRAANIYLARYRYEGEIRFDVISILVNQEKKYNIRHIKDAFWPES